MALCTFTWFHFVAGDSDEIGFVICVCYESGMEIYETGLVCFTDDFGTMLKIVLYL